MPIIDFRFRPHTQKTLETLSNSAIFRKGLLESGKDLISFVASAKSMADIAAELKEADFMRELISVAQVGRSLGVHLILAIPLIDVDAAPHYHLHPFRHFEQKAGTVSRKHHAGDGSFSIL